MRPWQPGSVGRRGISTASQSERVLLGFLMVLGLNLWETPEEPEEEKNMGYASRSRRPAKELWENEEQTKSVCYRGHPIKKQTHMAQVPNL